jgi:hypothetical protein
VQTNGYTLQIISRVFIVIPCKEKRLKHWSSGYNQFNPPVLMINFYGLDPQRIIHPGVLNLQSDEMDVDSALTGKVRLFSLSVLHGRYSAIIGWHRYRGYQAYRQTIALLSPGKLLLL